MAQERKVHCREHGAVRPAFVCKHLVEQLRNPGREPIGFFRPDPGTGETADELEGWCGACEGELQRVGEWNDESEGFAGVTLICEACYGGLRQTQGVH
jgi:hypothetical protein